MPGHEILTAESGTGILNHMQGYRPVLKMPFDNTNPGSRQFSLAAFLFVSLGIAATFGFFSLREHTLVAFIVFAPFWAWIWGQVMLRVTGAMVVLSSRLIDGFSDRRKSN